MAIEVIPDTIAGEASIDQGVTTIRRYFLVKGLDSAAPSARLHQAITAPGIPAYDDPHPSVAGLFAERIRADANRDPEKMFVVVDYTSNPSSGSGLSLSDPIEIRYENYMTEELVTHDLNDVQMITTYLGLRYNHRVNIDRPNARVVVTRTTDIDPETLNDTYSGTTNSVACKLGDTKVYQPQELRCDYFEGSSQRGAGLYRVSGVFLPSPYGDKDWRIFVEQRQQWLPVDDPTLANNGRAIYDIYPLTNFILSGFATA